MSLLEGEDPGPELAAFRGDARATLMRQRFTPTRRLGAADDGAVGLRFSDGSPALVSRRLGRGRLAVFAGSWTPGHTDLLRHPLSVALVHGWVREAGEGAGAPNENRPGEALRWPEGWLGADEASFELRSPGGVVRRIDAGPSLGAAGLYAEELGLHVLAQPGLEAPTAAVAVTLDARESEPPGAADGTGAMPGASVTTEAGLASDAPTTATGSLGADGGERGLWWPLMAMAAALLTGEAALSARRKPRGLSPERGEGAARA